MCVLLIVIVITIIWKCLTLKVIPTHTVDNIIDIQFLHGYNQPTLLILYEPLRYYYLTTLLIFYGHPGITIFPHSSSTNHSDINRTSSSSSTIPIYLSIVKPDEHRVSMNHPQPFE